MSGINNAINNALSGLEAFETGITTVANNMANASTDGYASESVDIQTSYLYPGQAGSGVEPAQIIRASSAFAASQLRMANTANAAASAQSTSLTALSNSLTNNGDIQTFISQFFSDINSLAANPSSTALRQTVLDDAQSVTSSFQAAATNINDVIDGAQNNLATGVTAANNLLTQLNNINQSLQKTPNSPSLLDQQQADLNALSEYLPVNTIAQSNGDVVVTSGGTVLLDQSGVQNLRLSEDSKGDPVITAGEAKALVSLLESDGSLGAGLATVNAGAQALQSLSNVAVGYASQVNQSQAEGLDAHGEQGQNMFSIPAPTVTAASGNTGTAQITASITGAVNLPITLKYNDGTWSAMNSTNGESYHVNGIPGDVAGLAVTLSGTVQNGDLFTINAAVNSASGIAVEAITGDQIAAADPYVATAGELPEGSASANSTGSAITDSNTGTITTGTDYVSSEPDSNAAVIPSKYFGQNLQVNFISATQYTVSVAGSTTPVIANGTVANGNGTISIQYPYNGAASGEYWQLPISGSPHGGDTLTLQPGGVSSGSNAQRMAGLWTASNTTGSGSLEQNVVGLATGLGTTASMAQQLARSTSSEVTTATSNLAAISGVNTDQQAVLLTNYQQSYQAAAQIITTAHSMFESLINAI